MSIISWSMLTAAGVAAAESAANRGLQLDLILVVGHFCGRAITAILHFSCRAGLKHSRLAWRAILVRLSLNLIRQGFAFRLFGLAKFQKSVKFIAVFCLDAAVLTKQPNFVVAARLADFRLNLSQGSQDKFIVAKFKSRAEFATFYGYTAVLLELLDDVRAFKFA